MKKPLIAILVYAFVQAALADDTPATQAEIESAWLAFSNARGEPSLIRGDVEHPSANDAFRIIPDVDADSLIAAKLKLGSDLFNEARLSRDGSVACSSCHIGMMGGADRRPLPFGIDGAVGSLNVPTIFNAALNFRQFWDGRALTLEDQVIGPIENPAEFGHDLDAAVAALAADPDYIRAFGRVYPDGVTAANLTDAIAYYETMNFTGLSSPFLRQFEEGEDTLDAQARRGQQRFVEVGCASCHNGVNLGGNSYQQLGVAEPWYDSARPADNADDGLFGRTGRERDRHVFKVPTLHNVAITGPWLHDGSIASLQQTVDRMARHQSGRYLSNEDIDDIVGFLRALGDSLGMVGDCSATGSYSVTMDCSINQTPAASGETARELAPLPDSVELEKQHAEQYKTALAHASEAPARIEAEMQRIRSGEVAHYDFLQYEHIEMLRHTRALFHPPASVGTDEREAMLSRAKELQSSAENYEWVIADFLRGHAVATSAKANYLDLLRILSAGADEKVLASLARAERGLLGFYEQHAAEARAELESATQALYGIGLNEERVEELEVQVGLLVASVGHD